MAKIKVTKLTKAENALKDLFVPEQKNGNVGNFLHATVGNQGYQMSNGPGVDIPGLGTEIKSKSEESTSAYSMGSLHYKNIIDYDFHNSSIKEKCQTIFKIAHSQTFRKVTDSRILDFTKPHIQEKLRDAFDTARDKMVAGDRSNYIKGHANAYGYFDRKIKGGVPTNNWAFRIPVKNMKSLEGMARTVDNMFE
jgi:hypothetical protein